MCHPNASERGSGFCQVCISLSLVLPAQVLNPLQIMSHLVGRARYFWTVSSGFLQVKSLGARRLFVLWLAVFLLRTGTAVAGLSCVCAAVKVMPPHSSAAVSEQQAAGIGSSPLLHGSGITALSISLCISLPSMVTFSDSSSGFHPSGSTN